MLKFMLIEKRENVAGKVYKVTEPVFHEGHRKL